MLERISNYKIKATYHRVRDIGRERYSCPFFFDPKYSARLSPFLLESSRTTCEDRKYEKDPKNEEEMLNLPPYGKVLVDVLNSKTYGEWKGCEFPECFYDYS